MLRTRVHLLPLKIRVPLKSASLSTSSHHHHLRNLPTLPLPPPKVHTVTPRAPQAALQQQQQAPPVNTGNNSPAQGLTTTQQPELAQYFDLHHGVVGVSPTTTAPTQPTAHHQHQQQQQQQVIRYTKPTLVLGIEETLLYVRPSEPRSPVVDVTNNNNNTLSTATTTTPSSIIVEGPGDGSSSPNASSTVFSAAVASQVWFRPFVKEFLSEVLKMYEVVLWSSSMAQADAFTVAHLLEKLLGLRPSRLYDPLHSKTFVLNSHNIGDVPFLTLCREHVVNVTGGNGKVVLNHIKYLPAMGRSMKRVVLLDHDPQQSRMAPRNGITCAPFRWFEKHRTTIEYAHLRGAVAPVGAYEGDLDVAKFLELSGRTTVDPTLVDTTLLDVLPVLKAAAVAPDATRELDHWRPAQYGVLDQFTKQYKVDFVAGTTTKGRQLTLLMPQERHEANDVLLDAAIQAVHHGTERIWQAQKKQQQQEQQRRSAAATPPPTTAAVGGIAAETAEAKPKAV